MTKLNSAIRFIRDYFQSLFSPSQHVSHSTYLFNRRLYSLTLGLSKLILLFPYKILYACGNSLPSSVFDKKHFLRYGCLDINLPESTSPIVSALTTTLQASTLVVSGKPYSSGCLAANVNTTDSLSKYSAARLFLPTSSVTSNPHLWELLATSNITAFVEHSLSCRVFLVSVSSWFVVPLTPELFCESDKYYSSASQLFHYDMDWIASIKVFIYLSDVTHSHAPFEFVLGSHKVFTHNKSFNMRTHQLPPQHAKNLYRFVGKAGSCFMMDSSGIHRDSIATQYSRHVLQLEFSPSLFGASEQNAADLADIRKGFLSYQSSYPELSRIIP